MCPSSIVYKRRGNTYCYHLFTILLPTSKHLDILTIPVTSIMKFSLAALAAGVALINTVSANFDVYRVTLDSHGIKKAWWQVFEAEPKNCDEVINTKIIRDRSDVSGDKTGIRCKGSGCGEKPPPGEIEQLEMHFRNDPLYHWSTLKPGHLSNRLHRG